MTTPHLTPEKLLGANLLPPTWSAAQTAFVCFTPFPNGFKNYVEELAADRYFLHSPNSEVRLCRYDDIPFIVVSEVYGFPVGVTTVEELVHHGIKHIIAVGYAGAFNAAPVGQPFVAKDTMSDLPIATHYGVREYVRCSPTTALYELLNESIKDNAENWGHFTVWNGNSLYRESPQIVQHMKDQGCDVVNMDTLSIYAATPVCARDAQREVRCIYVGTVTDSLEEKTEDWESDLIEAVKREKVHPHDKLVQFLVETFLPQLQ
jgi:uridine phosphorylase